MKRKPGLSLPFSVHDPPPDRRVILGDRDAQIELVELRELASPGEPQSVVLEPKEVREVELIDTNEGSHPGDHADPVAGMAAMDVPKPLQGSQPQPERHFAAMFELLAPPDVTVVGPGRRNVPLTQIPDLNCLRTLGFKGPKLTDLRDDPDRVLGSHDDRTVLTLQEGDWFAIGRIFITLERVKGEQGMIQLLFQDSTAPRKPEERYPLMRATVYYERVAALKEARTTLPEGSFAFWLPKQSGIVYRGRVKDHLFPSLIEDTLSLKLEGVVWTRVTVEPGGVPRLLDQWRPSDHPKVVVPRSMLRPEWKKLFDTEATTEGLRKRV